jgi:apolipoprotein N-acyltransferase
MHDEGCVSFLLLEAATGFWRTDLAYAWPALLFTIVGLVMRRLSRDTRTPRGDAVVVDLCLGLVAVTALTLWLVVFLRVLF